MLHSTVLKIDISTVSHNDADGIDDDDNDDDDNDAVKKKY